ncbi:hypothetical protein AGMMS49992_29170 [Clostridia bacterium]|nr:hypothetical protein AGMMS49992_29170 [Clostridia bacterium]
MFNKLSDVAFIGDAYLKEPIKAVVFTFHGLGHTAMRSTLDVDELELWSSMGKT